MNRRTFFKLTALTTLLNPTQPQRANASCAAPPWERLLAVDGNSISANLPARGGGLPPYRTWPTQLQDEPWMHERGFGLVNFSIKGTNIQAMSERASGGVDALGHAAQETYIAVWELTNTKYYWSISDTFHMHANYCKARRAAGFKVLVGTCISRNNEPVYHIPTGFTWLEMLELNNMIRTYSRDFADGVLDFAAVPQLGDEYAWQDTSIFFDHVHLTDAGSALCKDVVLAELQRQVAGSATATPEPTATATSTSTPTATATAQVLPVVEVTAEPVATSTATAVNTAAALSWVIPPTVAPERVYLPSVSSEE